MSICDTEAIDALFGLSNRTFDQLCDAIVNRAISDYTDIKNGKPVKGSSLEKLVTFFKSDWFYTITGNDGEGVMEYIDTH